MNTKLEYYVQYETLYKDKMCEFTSKVFDKFEDAVYHAQSLAKDESTDRKNVHIVEKEVIYRTVWKEDNNVNKS